MQNCEPPSTKHYLTVHLKIFKMVNSMLSIFYHNFLNSKKKMSCLISYSNNGWGAVWFSSVQFSRSVVFDSLRPHELQHARPPCPSPTPGVHSSDLAWRIPWTGEPGGLPSMGLRRVGHDWSDLAAAAVATHWLNNCNLLALGHAGFSLRHKGSLVVSLGCRACSFSSYGIQA